MITIYRLSAFNPSRHGFNEIPFKSMKSLNKKIESLKLKGFDRFYVDTYEVNR